MITRTMSAADRRARSLGDWQYFEIVNRRGRLVSYATTPDEAFKDARAILATIRRDRALRAYWTR